MLFVKADEMKQGMRLAKPIYNRDGVMLYERNSKLTRQGIVSIQNFGLIGVYILEPAEPVPPMSAEDIEFERFQTMAVFKIKELLDAVCKQKEPKGLYQFSNQILKQYGSLNHRINFIQNLRSTEDYVYKHSLNTAILAALMSHRMKMEFKQQLDVVVAALLHDTGSLLIPPHIRRKRMNEITPEDEKKIRTYHFAAYQMIVNDYDMDSEVKHILKALDVNLHDPASVDDSIRKLQSDGYEIVRVAYVFDTMTAMQLNEEPKSEVEAIRYLLDPKNGFDQDVVSALEESINILQPGVCVELTNGDRGLVVAGNDGDILAPMILSFKDNIIYNMADRYIAQEIQIKDTMRTMDNRHVVDTDLLSKYSGQVVHLGEKREKKTY